MGDILANDIVAGLDIGSSKVCAVIGEPDERGRLAVTGMGTARSQGITRGVIANIEAAQKSVSDAVAAAEAMSGRTVEACWLGIGGRNLSGINSEGFMPVLGRNHEPREITAEDVNQVLEYARATPIPLDKQVLELVPQTFSIDDQAGIRNPIDQIGVRLKAWAHIITCPTTSAQNLIKCVTRANIGVSGLIPQHIAASRAVLTDEEKELGVALVDIGGGSSNIMIFKNGAPWFTGSCPMGGDLVTMDISRLESISMDSAEDAKIEAGCCWEPLIDSDEEFIAQGIGGREPVSMSRAELCAIISARMEELFGGIRDELVKSGYLSGLESGVVLTGGGAMLRGAIELGRDILRLPMRVGKPPDLGGEAERYRKPSYATALGLVMTAWERENPESPDDDDGGGRGGPGGLGGGILNRIVDFFKREVFAN
jgi:cell division protein FtsA